MKPDSWTILMFALGVLLGVFVLAICVGIVNLAGMEMGLW